MSDVMIKGNKRIIDIAKRLPPACAAALKPAFAKALSRYRAKHRKVKMHAPPPPKWKGRVPVRAGVKGTRQRGGRTGLMKAFSIKVTGDRLMNMEGKLSTNHMIARQHEFGVTRAAGTIPLPPARDILGRKTKKARDLLKARGLIKIVRKRDNKMFLVIPHKGWKRAMRRARKAGKEADRTGRWIWMFHYGRAILKPRLSFLKLWRQSHREMRDIWFAALKSGVMRARRGA